MRRPTIYSPGEPVGVQSDAGHRPGSYRVIKSQSGNQMVPRYLTHASSTDANIYSSGQPPPAPLVMNSTEQPCAYLSMDMQLSKVSRAFCDAIGTPSVTGRKLLDTVAVNDRDKVYRLQRQLDEERQDREPNYLPPIYGRSEEDRIIQSLGFGQEYLAQFRMNRQDVLTFQAPDGQQRPYPVRLSLEKRESIYFVVLVITGPPTTLLGMTPVSPPSYSREPGHIFHNPPQPFAPSSMPPYGQFPHFNEPRHGPQVAHHQQPLRSDAGSSSAAAPNTPPYAQVAVRPEYVPSQYSHQPPRSDVAQNLGQRQSEYRLPPIQNTSGMASTGAQRIDDRGGRVDIGGLLENSEPQRRRPP